MRQLQPSFDAALIRGGAGMNDTLQGKSVYIIEDDPLSALAIKDIVEDLGCQVVGHARTLDEAMDVAGKADFDIALLDIDLDGDTSYKVASKLAARDVPFLFTTGQAEGGPEWCQNRPRVLKPFSYSLLERMMMVSLAPTG
jgi:CheY-like chemotaxis protein